MRRCRLSLIPVILVGKVVRLLVRVFHHSGGSAFPGLVVERLSKNFLKKMLSTCELGVVVVSGTNGKTTTTHLIAELLKSQGLKVFTNESGSNFARGVISEMLKRCSVFGCLKADVAVLELDEAHAVRFVKSVQPTVSVILNVMRDQMDRFGEIDKTAVMLGEIVKATTDTVVLNREDPRVLALANDVPKTTQKLFFGFDPKLAPMFVNDDELRFDEDDDDEEALHLDKKAEYARRLWKQPDAMTDWKTQQSYTNPNEVLLVDLQSENGVATATYNTNHHLVSTKMKLRGIHNAFNATAAISAVRAVMKNDLNATRMFERLKVVESAFGRGETIEGADYNYELVLVKNPAGFRLALISFEPDNAPVMIVINDEYADGRDVSWLWDVQFGGLKKKSVRVRGASVISGHRCYDMALRLQYSDVPVRKVEPNLAVALKEFAEVEVPKSSLQTAAKPTKRIYATYTAMLNVRKLLTEKGAF